MPGPNRVLILLALAGAMALQAKPPQVIAAGTIIIRDSGNWTLRLADKRPVKGKIGMEELESFGQAGSTLANASDSMELTPNILHTLQFTPKKHSHHFAFDVELVAGPESMYQGARLKFHLQRVRTEPGVKITGERWTSAGPEGVPIVTWNLKEGPSMPSREGVPALLEFN